MEWLAEETLCTASARHDKFVVVAEFVYAKDGDDILKVVVFLKKLLGLLSYVVVLFANDIRVEDT